MNARFWTCVNGGWVKLTVPQDAELHWHRGGQDEEGWSLEGHTWRNEGHVVLWEITDTGLDCDGRWSARMDGVCRMDQLEFFETGEARAADIKTPFWRWGETATRDFTAEAAGY